MDSYIQLRGDDCLISKGLNDPIWLIGSFSDSSLIDSHGSGFVKEIEEHNGFKKLANFQFYLSDKPQETIVLKPKSLFNLTLFQAKYLGKQYSIKIHMGYKYSFFEEDEQIAYMDRFEHPKLSSSSLKLTYNSNANLHLLIGMVFFLLKRRTNSFEGRELTFNISFRYKYNKNWRAN
jgi:hypothetical protein